MTEAEHDVGARWESTASAWIRWARTPGHDAFWSYRERFRSFLPPPGRSTLEIGVGEGRIARELTDLGHRVTAVELSRGLLDAARGAGSARHYVRGDAERLPVRSGGFDRVVAYNVLMDVADMPAAVTEIGRVLSLGGLATISIVHPFVDRGHFTDPGPDAAFVVEGSYFGRRHFTATERRDGLEMAFAGWSHPLEDYMAALRDAGLAVVDLAEPRPRSDDARRSGRWERFPLFCWITARRFD